MIKQKEVEINDTKYLLTQFDGVFGMKVLQKVQAVVIPVIAQMQRDAADGKDSAIIDAIEAFSPKFAELDSDLIISIIEKGATRNSMQIKFGRDFAGKYMESLNLLKEILLFNYEDVFSLLGLGDNGEVAE